MTEHHEHVASERPATHSGIDPGNHAPSERYGTRSLAGERTALASERTLLAWYRTSFGADALAIGIGSVIPSLTERLETAYAIVGVCFALVGVAAATNGVLHYRRIYSRMPDIVGTGPEKSPRLFFGVSIALLSPAIAGLIIADWLA